MAEADARPVQDLTFEDALKELETIVDRLEQGDVPLEASIQLYERGAALRAHCEARLSSARERIEAISVHADGQVSAAPLDASSQ